MITIDTETGGFDASRCALCEVAGLFWTDGPDGPEIIDQFSSLVRFNPNLVYDPAAMQVNGISFDDLADAPEESEVLEKFFAFLSVTKTVYGSNPAFDERFLRVAANRNRIRMPALRCIDIKDRFKEQTGLKSASLLNMAKTYNLAETQSHRALGDCELVAKVMWAMEHGVQPNIPKEDIPPPISTGSPVIKASRPSKFRRF